MKNLIVATLIGAGVFAAGCDTAQQKPASSNGGIANSGWLELRPAVTALDADLKNGDYGLIDEVLIVHDGQPVVHLTYDRQYETIIDLPNPKDGPFKYDAGAYAYADVDWHPYYKDTQLHTLMSVTKTITSLLIGIAEYRGDLPDIRQAKLLDHIDAKYQTPQRNQWLEDVTIEHILTLTMNLDWNESSASPLSAEGLTDIEMLEWEADDWVQYVLDKAMAGPPGVVFEYNSGATHLLSAVIEKATGQSAAAYAKEHLFTPLGIEAFYWKETPRGLSDTTGGLYLAAEEMPKFCDLMISGGLWNGNRILANDYVERSLSPISKLDKNWTQVEEGAVQAFGYSWVTPVGTAQENEGAFDANTGFGGQELYCSPATNTATVLLAWNVAEIDKPDIVIPQWKASARLKQRINDQIIPHLQPR